MRIFQSLIGLFSLLFVAAVQAAEFNVSEFVPQGEVKNIRQIRIGFSQPVVRMGNPRAESPIESSCLTKGNGRWIDSSKWVYDFEIPLSSGAQCQFKVKPKLQSLNGDAINGNLSFSFSTGKPQVEAIAPNQYSAIEDDQYFTFLFDGEISKEETAKLFKFSVTGLGDVFKASVVDSKSTTEVFKNAREHWQSVTEAEEDYYAARERRRNLNAVQSKLLVLKLDRKLPIGKILNIHYAGKIPQKFAYTIREDFKASFNCERENASAPCLPISSMNLNFNEYIDASSLNKIYIQDEKGNKILPKREKDSQKPEMYLTFAPPFPENAQLQMIIPSSIKGESGRALSNADKFPLKFSTGSLPPLLKFSAGFGIIEAGPEAAIPVTMRELEPEINSVVQKIFPNFSGQELRLDHKNFSLILEIIKEVRREDSRKSIFGPEPVNVKKLNSKPKFSAPLNAEKKISIAKPNGSHAFEVVGIPVQQPGFYLVEMVSPKLGTAIQDGAPYFVRSSALVTNLGVHVKYSPKEVLVWVTELKTGNSVANAQVELFNCNGNSFATGKTGVDGTVKLSMKGDTKDMVCNYESLMYSGFAAVASKGNDFSFTLSDWDRGIEPYRFQVPTYGRTSFTHSVIARNLLRPGEKLHMKHFIRKHVLNGFAKPDESDLPAEITLQHTTQESEYKIPVKWDLKTMTAETEWSLPKGMKLGNWQVKLGKSGYNVSGTFSVENFRVPLLKGQIQTPAKNIVQAKSIPVQLGLEYLGGGPASSYDVKLKWGTSVTTSSRLPDDYSDFTILNGNVKEGIVRQGDESEDESSSSQASELLVTGSKELKLDDKGAAAFQIDGLKNSPYLQSVFVEMTFKDPSGEYQSLGRSFTIFPSERLVGIHAHTFSTTPDKVGFNAVVVNTEKKPVADAPVEIELYSSESITHRKRLLGGFYSYEYFRDTKRIGTLCKGKTDARGILSCQTKLDRRGRIYAVAKTTDSNGKSSFANADQWIYDPKEMYWNSSNDGDRVDLIPSKKVFEPGETAQFEFKSPFKSGQILLSIERESEIEHQFIAIKNGGTQILSVPIKDTWAPNVFVSAIAVRGRVEDYKPTALVDLGRPAFKMGLANIKVGWKKHELKVNVELDKAVYSVRGKAKATIRVTDSNRKPVQGEVVLAAIDEGLLELQANNTWNLLEEMMSLRPLQVKTATSYGEIIGRRHYGIKAVASGGDGSAGGSGTTRARELFDTLLIWKGKVSLDSSGKAIVDIPINDSLTSFRVFAAAYSGADQFGSNYKSFQTTQDFMIFAGLPQVVRQGDKFVAEYTVRNASNKEQAVVASLQTNFQSKDQKSPYVDKTLTLKPQTSERVEWTLQIPELVSSVETNMSLKTSEGKVVDKIKKTMDVREVHPVRVQQMTMEQVDNSKKDFYVDKVPNSVADSTSAEVTLNKSLIGSSAGQTDFWKYYPYSCLEQKTSRAVALSQKSEWEKVSKVLDAYFDDDGLLKYFPDQVEGSDTLTAYVMSIVYEAGWEISDRHLDLMSKGLKKVLDGKIKRYRLAFADEEFRRMIIMEALSKHRRLAASDLHSIEPKSQIWPTAQVVTWYQILLLEKRAKQREQQIKEVEQVLKSRIYMSGAKATLQDHNSNFFWWLMVDPSTVMARFFQISMNQNAWKADMPKLVRGFVETQRKGSWFSTTSNAWGVLALKSYVGAFEKAPISGETKVSLDSIEKSMKWTQAQLTEEFKKIEKKQTLSVQHNGTGKPWAFVTMKAAVPLTAPLVSGFKVEKVYEAVEQKAKPAWSRGDIVRVKMKVTSLSDNGWVAVYDPIPSGASVMGGLARQSSMVTQQQTNMNELWATAEERAYDSYRSYYYWFPKGTFDISYTMRLNQAGEFPLPTTRVEAMYNADLFGEFPNALFTVKE